MPDFDPARTGIGQQGDHGNDRYCDALRRSLGSRPASSGVGVRAGSRPSAPHAEQLRRPFCSTTCSGWKTPSATISTLSPRCATAASRSSSCTTYWRRQSRSRKAKKWILDNQVVPNQVGLGLVDEVRSYLDGLQPRDLAETLIGGLSTYEFPDHMAARCWSSCATPPASTNIFCLLCPTRSTPATRPAGSTAA